MEYNEKMLPILSDLENKEIEIAGGSCVGMILAITSSLVKYICNLTIGKKKYEDVQEEVLKIYDEAELLKKQALIMIDKDKKILEDILNAYKLRKENLEELQKANREAALFCLSVTKKALETLKLTFRISEVGNKMLESDFKICKLYSFASVEASIVNIEINLDSIEDKEFVLDIKKQYNEYLEEAQKIIKK